MFLRTGEELSISALIPPVERIERIELIDELAYVLIVEKDVTPSAMICGMLTVRLFSIPCARPTFLVAKRRLSDMES